MYPTRALIPEGEVIGRLTATARVEARQRPDGRNRYHQWFLCSCGKETCLVPHSVRTGNTRSCGCLHSEVVSDMMRTHGLSKTSAYRVKLNKARRALKRATAADVTTERLTAAVFDEILAEYSNQCWICCVKLEVVQWDHVHPLSKGGAHTRSNMRPSCKECNSKKGAVWPFTEDMKNKIANEVRASRTPQADLPVTDGMEVH